MPGALDRIALRTNLHASFHLSDMDNDTAQALPF